MEVLRSLYQKYPNVFSFEEQTNSEVKWAVKVIYSISLAILNFSDLRDKFCEACGRAGVVKECLKLLEGLKMCTHDFSDTRAILEGPKGTKNRFSRIGSVGFEVLGVIYNLSKSIVNKKYFDSCGAVETLLSFYGTPISEYRMTALLCLAYLVDEMNNHLIMATEEAIKDLLELLEGACNSNTRRSLGFSAEEIAYGLRYVASHDGNKKMIGQLGGISVLAAMLKDATDQGEKSAAANALYVLSFDKENKDIIKDDSDIMGLLRNLQHSGDKAIRQAMSGVIWEIAGKEEHKPKSSEAEYAYELRKKIIPLMMEENYKPDGWLGLILGTKLYMHFEKDPHEGIQQLLKEILNAIAADIC
ncbi:hypothetical protein P5673_009438 [Acropora cervicornis]|uniref:Uncharacterized protein n=1 Tax=Acropora cervicornis TaxID=6130 RepID=A0AAD9VA05_ACRCE|nr:hypothetical protein P5673_009438 [Acropora cervicornis]